MTDARGLRHILEGYLQADTGAGSVDFKSFLVALSAVSTSEGAEAAREWAVRAVSPTLDYSSLRKLRKYLVDQQAGGLRIAVLGGPTTSQLVELIEIFLAGAGIQAEIFEGEYGLFRQEILAPGSALDSFRPQVIFLATGASDVALRPDLSTGAAEISQLLEAELANWSRLWSRANERWGATVIQNSFV